MQRLTLVIGLSLSFPAVGKANQCVNILAPDSPRAQQKTAVEQRKILFDEFTNLFYDNLTGKTPEEDLRFAWNIPFPPVTKYLENGSVKFLTSSKPNRDYIGYPGDREMPIPGISRMGGFTSVDSEPFYEQVYSHYEGVIRQRLIVDLKEVDRQLENERSRLSLGTVGDFGSMRIFDGSKRPFGLQFSPVEPGDPVEGSPLPFQRINAIRGLSLLKVELFLRRAVRAGMKVFEVGKYSLEGPLDKKSRAQRLIEAFWLKNFADVYPDAIFVAHVASQGHVRHFHRLYGFKATEKFTVPGNQDAEYILWTTGRELAVHLRKRLKFTPSTAPDAGEAVVLPIFDRTLAEH